MLMGTKAYLEMAFGLDIARGLEAEGVQNESEEFTLWLLGLNQGQGYKLSPPVPAKNTIHFLI